MTTIEDSIVKRDVALYSFEAVTCPNTFDAEEGVDGFRYRY